MMRPATVVRSLLVALIWCAALAPSTASALPPAPILDDQDRATRLKPTPDAFEDPTVEATLPEEPEQPVSPEREWSLVTIHSRWVSVPDFILGALFDAHPSYNNVSIGAGIDIGSPDSGMWVVELDWTPIIPTAGNWLTAGDPAISASYVESTLHMLSIDVTYRWYVTITPQFHWIVGSGLGVGVLVGDIETTEVLPTCDVDVAACPHWRDATREALDLPTRVVPILHLTTGFQYAFDEDLIVRLSAGFRDVFYVGLTVGTHL